MTRARERWLWAAAVIALAAVLAFVLVATGGGGSAPAPSGVADAPVGPVPAEPPSPRALPTLSRHELARLHAAGFDDPAREIVRDLVGRPELIPHEGVLGGTMYFLEADSHVLTDRWVLATYEDGHIRGRALFEYRLIGGDSISWRRVAAYIE